MTDDGRWWDRRTPLTKHEPALPHLAARRRARSERDFTGKQQAKVRRVPPAGFGVRKQIIR